MSGSNGARSIAPSENGGSVGTVAALLAKHERTIRRYVSRRSGPMVLRKATAEDIFQETVAFAVANAGTFVFADDRSFLAWIFTIVRRVISGLFRSYGGRVATQRIKGAFSTGVGVQEDELDAHGRTPSSFAAHDERTVALRDGIASLPPLQREVVTLHKIEQLTLAEVARRIGRTEGHTCRIAAEAMRILRFRLAQP